MLSVGLLWYRSTRSEPLGSLSHYYSAPSPSGTVPHMQGALWLSDSRYLINFRSVFLLLHKVLLKKDLVNLKMTLKMLPNCLQQVLMIAVCCPSKNPNITLLPFSSLDTRLFNHSFLYKRPYLVLDS